MSKTSYDSVKKWRHATKHRLIQALGSKCQICGYNKCEAALDFHHVDPEQKDSVIGKLTAHPSKWEKIVAEARKCVLLCSNCHRELHVGQVELPETFQKFDEQYAVYNVKRESAPSFCPICGNLKLEWNLTCSVKCAHTKSYKVNWTGIDLEALVKSLPVYKIADRLGVSDKAVSKRIRKHHPDLVQFLRTSPRHNRNVVQ